MAGPRTRRVDPTRHSPRFGEAVPLHTSSRPGLLALAWGALLWTGLHSCPESRPQRVPLRTREPVSSWRWGEAPSGLGGPQGEEAQQGRERSLHTWRTLPLAPPQGATRGHLGPQASIQGCSVTGGGGPAARRGCQHPGWLRRARSSSAPSDLDTNPESSAAGRPGAHIPRPSPSLPLLAR